jgi:hypothetical protein
MAIAALLCCGFMPEEALSVTGPVVAVELWSDELLFVQPETTAAAIAHVARTDIKRLTLSASAGVGCYGASVPVRGVPRHVARNA